MHQRAARRYFERLGLDLDTVLATLNVSLTSDVNASPTGDTFTCG